VRAAVAALVLGCVADAPTAAGLEGTAWQLVRIRFIDAEELPPAQRGRYTIAFGSDGAATLRIDCNRGRGPWRAGEGGAFELGPLATTRVACPPGSRQDAVVRALSELRSYSLGAGALVLGGDTGSLEWEPLAGGGAP
jgi:heat shock protein HslJ